MDSFLGILKFAGVCACVFMYDENNEIILFLNQVSTDIYHISNNLIFYKLIKIIIWLLGIKVPHAGTKNYIADDIA